MAVDVLMVCENECVGVDSVNVNNMDNGNSNDLCQAIIE